MADLCPEPTAIEITATSTCIEPCLSEEPRPATEDDECDDAADAKKAAADNGVGRPICSKRSWLGAAQARTTK